MSFGAILQTLHQTTAAVDNLRDKCNMSKATEREHKEVFDFKFHDGLPPMVDDTDVRIQKLVEQLKYFRQVKRFDKSNESECRSNAIDPFFEDVATCLEVEKVSANTLNHLLKVKVGRSIFEGNSDLFLGPKDGHPTLGVEIKPMKGDSQVPNAYSKLSFNQKAQIVLQCASLQSVFVNTGIPFSCVLTNLNVMYVVQVESYDGGKITAKFFRGLSIPHEFVRALLKAADLNASITSSSRVFSGPVVCDTTDTYDCNRPDLKFSGIPQFSRNTGVGTNDSGRDQETNANDDVDHVTLSDSIPSTSGCFGFERMLPLAHHQKHGIRANYTQIWLRLSEPVPFVDRSSTLNMQEGSRCRDMTM